MKVNHVYKMFQLKLDNKSWNNIQHKNIILMDLKIQRVGQMGFLFLPWYRNFRILLMVVLFPSCNLTTVYFHFRNQVFFVKISFDNSQRQKMNFFFNFKRWNFHYFCLTIYSTHKKSLDEFDYAIILHSCHNSRFKKPVNAKALQKNVNNKKLNLNGFRMKVWSFLSTEKKFQLSLYNKKWKQE